MLCGLLVVVVGASCGSPTAHTNSNATLLGKGSRRRGTCSAQFQGQDVHGSCGVQIELTAGTYGHRIPAGRRLRHGLPELSQVRHDESMVLGSECGMAIARHVTIMLASDQPFRSTSNRPLGEDRDILTLSCSWCGRQQLRTMEQLVGATFVKCRHCAGLLESGQRPIITGPMAPQGVGGGTADVDDF